MKAPGATADLSRGLFLPVRLIPPRSGQCGLLSATFLTACLMRFATAADTGFEVLVRLHYDIEVISFCGSGGKEVQLAYQRELIDILRRYDITQERDKQARFEAARRADGEWNNRGLGGFRHWCRQEGQAAVRRFTAMPASGRY